MNNQLPNPSRLTLYSGLIFLAVFTVVMLVFLVSNLIGMSQQWSAMAGVFVFNKGVFYIPGIILGLIMLIFVIVYESVLRKHLSEKLASYCTRTGIAAVVLMFVLPNFVEYSIERYYFKFCDYRTNKYKQIISKRFNIQL